MGGSSSQALVRVLHLFSNWKWTGPAEPAVHACLGLLGHGVDARFACGRAGHPDTIQRRAAARGLEPVLPDLWLTKHRTIFKARDDIRRLRAYVAEEGIRILHAHLPHAHRIAVQVAKRLDGVRVVRTVYRGDRYPPARWQSRLLARTDGCCLVAARVREDLLRSYAYPKERALQFDTAIDLDRFSPGRALPDLRAELQLEPDAFVVGIVARMQRHRRFEMLLEALRRAHAELPSLRAVVIGRGTNQVEVAKAPAAALGLADVVRFPGYLDGARYVGALAALDVKVFLVPGTDGSCRAVREAQAMALPIVATRRGMLEEMVTGGEDGLLIDDEPASLAAALVRLGRDPALRRAMGGAARQRARTRYDIAHVAKTLLGFYRRLEALPPRSGR